MWFLLHENVTPVPVPDFVTPPAHVIQYAAPLKHLWFDEFAILQWFGEPHLLWGPLPHKSLVFFLP